MQWAQTLDASLFHLINHGLSSSWLDALMPFASGNALFWPVLLVVAAMMLWRGGARGRVCLLMFLLIIPLGDILVCNMLKHAIQRPRPFLTLADVHLPPGVGRADSGSMPSGHAANWFAATMIAFIYYRRSIRFMLPLAVLVGFSRIYNGVHYPSDVLAGAILGTGYAVAGVWVFNALWQWIGRRWFPLWWERMPSLFNPVVSPASPGKTANPALLDEHWARLAYALIFIQLALNLAYIASGTISLSADEAYQWIWSKHLALSYYSKPLLIAVTQFLGTSIWGDTVFGVRFFSPVIIAATSIIMFRFMRRVANVRAAFWLSIILPAIPMIAVGSTLMTVDPLSVMFWLLAMMAGWRAIEDDSTTADWLWVGLWMGLGLLSKYHSLYQLLSWAIFFALYPPARKQLRRAGPYLGLLLNLLCATPIVVWNYQKHWVTITHVSQDAHFDQHWAFTPGNLVHGFLKYTTEFLGAELGLQNPFFFVPVVVTAIIFWRKKPVSPLLIYFFSMSAPLFLVYFFLSFHSRVLPNWPVQAIIPSFCLAVVYWEARWRDRLPILRICLTVGIILGLIGNVVLRDTDVLAKAVPLPAIQNACRAVGWNKMADSFQPLLDKIPVLDSTRRVRGWKETAEIVEAARHKLEAEGKPVFIICNHYGIAGEMTFNIPEAKAHVRDHPFVYFHTSDVPQNQFYFWPGYLDRKGQNALYLIEMDLGETNAFPVPEIVKEEFESATDLGMFVAKHDGRPMHRLQIFECRGLR